MGKYRKLKILIAVLTVIVLFMFTINVIPVKDNVESNPFVVEKGELPLIAAPGGGILNNPGYTMLAYRSAVKVHEVDIIIGNLYLTKDGRLVINGEPYIDKNCNINGELLLSDVEFLCETEENCHYIADMTLEELKQYNFGWFFGSGKKRPYIEPASLEVMGLQITTVDELFEEFYKDYPELKFIFEIGDDGESGRKALETLNIILDKYPEYKDQMIVSAANDEIESELKTKYPEFLRIADTGDSARFIATQYLGVNIIDKGDYACLQIPTSFDFGITFQLDTPTIMRRANKRNISVQYTDVNTAKEMRTLINRGCDCIITDNPKVLRRVLGEYIK